MRQGVKRKATSPIPGPKTAKIPDETLSEIGQNLLFKPEVHIDRLSPTHLELTKESPVKVITENPLVIQPAMVSNLKKEKKNLEEIQDQIAIFAKKEIKV